MKSPPYLFLIFALTICGHGFVIFGAETTKTKSIPIFPRDLISVTVFDELDMSVEETQLDNAGRVSIPLLGIVQLGGLTVSQGEDVLKSLYLEREILNRPQVSISIIERYLKEASVVGEVYEPGVVQFPLATESMEILSAIARAGGFTRIAKTNAVRVTRRKDDGTEQLFIVDARALMKGEDDIDVFNIVPGDVIFVDERIF